MSNTLDEVRDKQRETWNKFSGGWKRWDEFVMQFLRPVGEELIKAVHLKENSVVLDVATGTGEPGLTAASIAKKGKVIATDLAEDMIAVANENAQARKLSNFSTKVCDAGAMPFSDEYFDAVLVRMGFMFFPDTNQCAKEIFRVLKKGGRVSASVWAAPEKNPWATTIIGTVNKMAGVEPPPPDTPGLFRCAKIGMMKDVFEKAGLKNVSEKEIIGTRDFDNPQQYWDFMISIAAPVVAVLNKADESFQKQIKETVLDITAKNFSSGGRISFPWTAAIITGEK